MSITRKMHILLLLGCLGIAVSMALDLMVIERQTQQSHADRAQAITQVALGVVTHLEEERQRGAFDLGRAQELARLALQAMRYDDDYVYVLDKDGIMLAHPLRPDWIGRDLSKFRDVDGVWLFPLMRESANTGGSAFSYRVALDKGGEPQSKVAYSQFFPPWGWFITTGSFDATLQESYWRAAGKFTLSQLPLLAVLLFAAFWVSRRVARPIRQLAKATDQIRHRHYDVTLTGEDRDDEIGLLTRALVDLRQAAMDGDELRRQRDLAAKVFDTSHEGIVITDADGVVLTVNPAFEAISGFSARHVIGAKPSVWQSKQHDADFYAEMWRTLEQDGRWDGEIRNRRHDGTMVLVQQTIYRVRDERGQTVNHVAVQRDVTEARRQRDRIEYLAYHDPLTDLPNRALLMDRLGHGVSSAERSTEKLAVLFLDLDRFKAINDTLGHDVGDQVLQQVAERLRGVIRKADTVARMGGDEFVVLMERLDNGTQIAQTLERILASLNRPMELDGGSVHCLPSIGVAVYPDDGQAPLELLKNADAAMYAAKGGGGNTFSFFSADMTEKTANRFRLEVGLREALAQQQFQIYFQPKLCMKTGQTRGAEALLRWVHPQNGVVSPANFIPLAEEIGLIGEIGAWVIDETCRTMAQWPVALGRDLKVAINVSAQQLVPEFVESVTAIVARHGLSPRQIELELTESSIMGNPERVIAILAELRRCGFTIAIDDFGTGYSSLSYLKNLPIDVLKIDRAFVMNAVDDATDGEIVGTIIALAKALKLSTVAEGVETEPQWRFLRRAGCSMSQGYLHGRPMPAADFIQWQAMRQDVDQPWQQACLG